MKTFDVNGDKYKFICMVHNDIESECKEIQARVEHVLQLYKVACEMGQNMEAAIIDRNDKIDILNEKVAALKEKLKKEKAKHGRSRV